MDITRQIESRQATKFPGGQWNRAPRSSFPKLDIPNDDAKNGDEDVIVKNQHIYSADWPGTAILQQKPKVGTESLARLNFNEFVRVSVGKKATRPVMYQDKKTEKIVNPGMAGSRASEKERWFAKLWVIMEKNGFTSKPNTQNVVTLGKHDPLNTP